MQRVRGVSGALRAAAASLVVLTLLHDLDHLRQGRELPWALDLIGAAATTASVALLIWVWRRGAGAAKAAALFGAATAIGLTVVHVVPRWSWLSDPYPEAGVDALSWLGLFALIGSGIALATIAWRYIRPG